MINTVTYRQEAGRTANGVMRFTLFFHLESNAPHQVINIEWSVTGFSHHKELLGSAVYEAFQKLESGDVEVGNYNIALIRGKTVPMKAKVSNLVHPPDFDYCKEVLEILSKGIPKKVLDKISMYL